MKYSSGLLLRCTKHKPWSDISAKLLKHALLPTVTYDMTHSNSCDKKQKIQLGACDSYRKSFWRKIDFVHSLVETLTTDQVYVVCKTLQSVAKVMEKSSLWCTSSAYCLIELLTVVSCWQKCMQGEKPTVQSMCNTCPCTIKLKVTHSTMQMSMLILYFYSTWKLSKLFPTSCQVIP